MTALGEKYMVCYLYAQTKYSHFGLLKKILERLIHSPSRLYLSQRDSIILPGI